VLNRAAAIGFRVHSGWAAMVAVAGPVTSPMVVRRCRIELSDRAIGGSKQPYHTAEPMRLDEAAEYLRRCSDCTAAMARKALREVVGAMSGFRVAGACLLLASGRPLPNLAGILASHALIHTAEGEFYRAAVRDACEHCGLPQIGVKERDLAEGAGRVLGRSREELQGSVTALGKGLGPPWQQDQKLAALAAWLMLARVRSRE
jgi:hypothetical protein